MRPVTYQTKLLYVLLAAVMLIMQMVSTIHSLSHLPSGDHAQHNHVTHEDSHHDHHGHNSRERENHHGKHAYKEHHSHGLGEKQDNQSHSNYCLECSAARLSAFPLPQAVFILLLEITPQQFEPVLMYRLVFTHRVKHTLSRAPPVNVHA